MGKFLNMMSSSSSQTLRNRAEQLNALAFIAQKAAIAKLRAEKHELEIKHQKMMLEIGRCLKAQAEMPLLFFFLPFKWIAWLYNSNISSWEDFYMQLQEYKADAIRLGEINVELEIALEILLEDF